MCNRGIKHETDLNSANLDLFPGICQKVDTFNFGGQIRLRSCLLILASLIGFQFVLPVEIGAQSQGPTQPRANGSKPLVHRIQPVQNTGRLPQNRLVAPAQIELADAEQTPMDEGLTRNLPTLPAVNLEQYLSPQGVSTSLGMTAVLTILSLAPAILMMSTCFVRFIVVLSLLRQALGTPNLPPNQVLTGLALFLTFLVMAPVWNECYQKGIRPYVNPTSEAARPNPIVAFENTARPLRRFMSQQIELAQNPETVWMLIEYYRPLEGTLEFEAWKEPETYDDVPLTVLLPAYLLSELKTAFLIGFQIYLPFLVLDMVIASTLVSMGLTTLSPSQISLPFKLLLFVLIDGWTLTVGMLIESVRLVT